ncbi:Checkpoint protein HUS1 [Turdus rufiventris]|nr:Checkpoint protein HUS1 [Turdus rufiventris]
MRFRAKIVDLACLNHFSRIINTIAKLAKTCILRLTVCKLYFILSDKVANGGASMWCELSQGNFFDEFQMEGVAAEHNEIYLELVPENLSRALKTAQNAKAVKIKLTNKHCPCLSVAVELVSIYLPALKTMKSVVERMKNLSNFIVIEANLSGEMNLKIETDLVSITTHFKDLGNPPWASEDECQSNTQDRDLESMAEACIDIKKLQQLLAGQQVNPTKALCIDHGVWDTKRKTRTSDIKNSAVKAGAYEVVLVVDGNSWHTGVTSTASASFCSLLDSTDVGAPAVSMLQVCWEEPGIQSEAGSFPRQAMMQNHTRESKTKLDPYAI